MTGEIITMIGVGIALAAVQLAGHGPAWRTGWTAGSIGWTAGLTDWKADFNGWMTG